MPPFHRQLFAHHTERQLRGVTLSAADDLSTHRHKLARIVLDQMFQFVGLLAADGTTLEINRAALEGAAIALEDIQGRPFWEARWWAVSVETRETARDMVGRAGRGEFVRCDIEVFGKAAGEQTIVIDFSVLPVRDEDGNIVFLLAEGRDITEKKHAEAELARKTQELQNLLDTLRQVDQLKSDFFANVSHELRTPLALILGPAEALLSGTAPLTAVQRRDLHVIHRNAAALLNQVNDLLDLAKLDAGKLGLHYARVDLAQWVRKVAGQFHALAPQRPISYAVEAPERLPAELDPEKFERVLLNLLSNAFKFTPAGGRIRVVLEPSASGTCILSVQDTGPGVPLAMRQAIFERFRQVPQVTGRDAGGTGLGLAIAKEIVGLHRGTMVVLTAPGGGALFQAELPVQAPAGTYVREWDSGAEPLALRSSPLAADGLGPESHPPADLAWGAQGADAARILVVEDNPEMRRFVCEVLATDYQVQAVADGQQALAQLAQQTPDLVLTDLMMPQLGGAQLVAQMRAQAQWAQVPVLVLSAQGDETLRAQLLAESVQDYVTKPFSAHELRARVRNLVMMKRARDALQHELVTQNEDLSQLTRQLIANRQTLQRSLEALQESDHRWQALYEHSPVGIALVDAVGHLRTTNPAFQNMLGYGREALQNCSIFKITPAEDHATLQARLARLVSGEVQEYHLQRRYQHHNGSLVWANTSVSVIPPSRRTPRMLVLVAEDMTERQAAAEALGKAQNELARVARVSTLGELAASIAHEVNQPLAAVVANAQACLRWLSVQPPNTTEVTLGLQRMVRDGNRASEVIARIRHFLKRREPLHSTVEVGEMVEEVMGLVEAQARAQRISLHHRVSPGLPPVQADRIQLQQVLLNLVMNAFEAMHSSSAQVQRQVEISAQRHDGEEAMVVAVRDNGTGIRPGDRDHIFDAFHTTKPEGLGMGLAISRSIVEAHGGRLWVSTNPDGGATFCFTLPYPV